MELKANKIRPHPGRGVAQTQSSKHQGGRRWKRRRPKRPVRLGSSIVCGTVCATQYAHHFEHVQGMLRGSLVNWNTSWLWLFSTRCKDHLGGAQNENRISSNAFEKQPHCGRRAKRARLISQPRKRLRGLVSLGQRCIVPIEMLASQLPHAVSCQLSTRVLGFSTIFALRNLLILWWDNPILGTHLGGLPYCHNELIRAEWKHGLAEALPR